MEDYNNKVVKQGLTHVTKNGVHLSTVAQSYTATVTKEANIQGTKLMKVKKLTEVVRNVVSSKTDASLFGHIVDNCKLHNIVTKESSKEPATTEYLAKRYGVSVQKVRTFIRKAIESDFLTKSKGRFIVNPFTVVPFTVGTSPTINDQIANQLQLWWTGSRENCPTETLQLMDDEELLTAAANNFMNTKEDV